MFVLTYPLGLTIAMFAVNFRLELSLLPTSGSLILHLPVRIHDSPFKFFISEEATGLLVAATTILII
jgi:hypothetical protein